jgi:hypothetical protein
LPHLETSGSDIELSLGPNRGILEEKAGGKDAYPFDYEDSTGDLGSRVKTASAKGGMGINS